MITARRYLKNAKTVVGLPVFVKFRRASGETAKIPAKRGTYIVTYMQALRAIRMREQEIVNKIKETEEYRMGDILDSDIRVILGKEKTFLERYRTKTQKPVKIGRRKIRW